MKQPAHPLKRVLAWLLSAVLAAPGPLHAAATQISDEPVSQPPSNVKPNIMLILDDSLSMELQATPDYLTRAFGTYAPANPFCFGAATATSINPTLANCEVGDPPLHSPDMNGQYYNPEIYYAPAINYDGTDKTSMTSANTAGWTAVPTDGVSSIASTPYRKTTLNLINNNESSATNTADLVAGYPDRIWCNAATTGLENTASNFTGTPPVCVRQSNYDYPNPSYFGGGGTDASIRKLNGAPYYYRIIPQEHCTDITLVTCVASSTPTLTHPIPARVRYCDSTALTNCKAKKTGSFTRPKYTGKIQTGVAANPGQVAIATITVPAQPDPAVGELTAINVNGVNIINGTISFPARTNPATAAELTAAATQIRDAINIHVPTTGPDYHATVSGSTVTVRYGPNSTASPTPTATGGASTGTPAVLPNTFPSPAITVTYGTLSDTASATTIFTLSNVTSGDTITGVSVGSPAVQLFPSTQTCSGAGCPASGGGSASTRNRYLAGLVVDAINANSGTHGYAAALTDTSGTATSPSATLKITAPAGSSHNGKVVSVGQSGVAVTFNSPATANFNTSGATSGDISLTLGNFSQGLDPTPAVPLARTELGTWERTDIKPFLDDGVTARTFTKHIGRTDCAGAVGAGGCTYAEEMTNFANWFSYYRFRMAMAKTAIGRAFGSLGNTYRIGGITINPVATPSTISSTTPQVFTTTTLAERFIAASDFTTTSGGQKDLWYQWLYKQKGNGSTPLREALSRVGRHFAGKTDGINANMPASPVTSACQPNYAILVTDGYWFSDPGGKDLSSVAIGNVDSSDSGFSLRLEARYDGALASSTGTLADVALYYYQNDLRSDLADQVPVSTRDPNPKQHMTTFAVGLGLSGQLNFHPSYESGSSPDFERLKTSPGAGGLDWPVPVANTETALDDLWHAAVNGRGTFFSAQNPQDLADAIRETLDSVSGRIGAGAAAATSNLQPIAGDNFAFTAQFETSTWIGDIKARTIDLDTGTVASRVLWSAASRLDQTAVANNNNYDLRKIYTFDAGDTSPTVTIQNGPKVSVTSITQVGGIAVVVAPAHGFTDGAQVQIAGATLPGYNIAGNITFIDANSFSYPVSSSLASPAAGTLTAGPARLQNGNRLKSFCWVAGNGTVAPHSGCAEPGLTTAEMDYFQTTVTSPGSSEPQLEQTPALTLNGTTAAATKERLIDYLRGDRANEITTGGVSTSDLFRGRVSVLGDVVSAQPAYVKKSPFSYNTGNFAGRDPHYGTYRDSGLSATRTGTVYVASNDGFLHAFHTDPDEDPYFQTAGISTTTEVGDLFTGTLNTSGTDGEGAERWAYVPGISMSRMKRLADKPYTHSFITDGTPVVGDVCFGHTAAAACASATNWRTILVAGLNAGGRGYYALDVSDPNNPKGLWELKGGPTATCIAADADVDGTQTEDCNIGLTFGNPLIVKLPGSYLPAADAGKWVVIVSSGYNNVASGIGDGVGHLYIIDAETGNILKRMSTTAGEATTPTPSGLGKINAWVDSAAFDNTALTIYGGDLLGNLWRFQLANVAGPPAIASGSVTRIATFKGPGNTAQPISTKPELGEVSSKRVVFVGTGRFLGSDDKTSVDRQSIYGIKDNMDSTSSPTVAITRSGSHPSSTISGFVKQTLAASTVNPDSERTVATVNTVDFSIDSVFGWFVDLPDGVTIDAVPDPDVVTAGAERVNVDPVLQLGTLVVPSNIPSTDTCVAGGFGWINLLDYKTGAQVSGATANMASTKVSGSLVVGINVVQLPGGTVKAIVTTADNQQLTKEAPVAPSALQGRRVSWRELFFE